jgi:hypothetical protein
MGVTLMPRRSPCFVGLIVFHLSFGKEVVRITVLAGAQAAGIRVGELEGFEYQGEGVNIP